MNKKKIVAKQLIAKACNNCKDCKYDEYGNVETPCRECLKRFVQIDKYSEANIPADYWNRSIDSFQGNVIYKDFLQNYIDNIENNYNVGKSICLAGGVGRGKTFGACDILKSALLKKYTTQYDTMGIMVSTFRENNYYKKHLISVDFLVIDEIDSRFLPQSQAGVDFISNCLEIILRTRCQNLMPTIICTNEEDGDISKGFNDMFQAVFNSLKSQYIETFFVSGKDFRTQ